MNRRDYLAATLVSALAGCSSRSTSDTPNENDHSAGDSSAEGTQSPSQSPTESTQSTTQNPDGPQPIIQEVSLLTHWDEFDDVLSNQIDAMGKGGYAVVGVRYDIPVHDGEVHERVQPTIYRDGSRVDSRSVSETRLVDETLSEQTYERWLGFDTEPWERGEYTVEFSVRDEVTEIPSRPASDQFSVEDPLRPDEVEFIEVVSPPQIEAGEPVSYSLRFANVGDRDGSIVSTVSERHNSSEWEALSGELVLNIPEGEVNSLGGEEEITFDQAGTYEYRANAINETWTVTVTEA